MEDLKLLKSMAFTTSQAYTTDGPDSQNKRWGLSETGLGLIADIAFEKIEKQIQYPDSYNYGSIKYNYLALAAVALKLADLDSQEKDKLQCYIQMSDSVNEPEIQHLM